MIIVTDSGILSAVTNPNAKRPSVLAIKSWARDIRAAGHTFCIPSICDYEVRRKLTLNAAINSLAALDLFCQSSSNLYLPITDRALRRATKLWAQARGVGKPTSHDAALDGDVILCAQLLEAGFEPGTYIVATTNTKHLSLFVDAAEWQSIVP